MAKSQPKILYFARDMDFHSSKACESHDDAVAYIGKQSGKGYVEIFELKGDYYYFKTAEWIGPTDKRSVRGSVFGAEATEGIHKNFIPFILGYTN